MNLFGVSGAQGAGKTSVLQELSSRGWKVDQFKVSRAVQAELGWNTLDRVMESPSTMIDFQQRIFNQKFKHDLEIQSDEPIFTERTFADIFSYTALWTQKFVDQYRLDPDTASKFLARYLADCKYAQRKIYSAGVVLIPLMSHIPWDNDPNRAKKEEATEVYKNIESFVRNSMPVTFQTLVITTESVQDRATQIEDYVRTRNANSNAE